MNISQMYFLENICFDISQMFINLDEWDKPTSSLRDKHSP